MLREAVAIGNGNATQTCHCCVGDPYLRVQISWTNIPRQRGGHLLQQFSSGSRTAELILVAADRAAVLLAVLL